MGTLQCTAITVHLYLAIGVLVSLDEAVAIVEHDTIVLAALWLKAIHYLDAFRLQATQTHQFVIQNNSTLSSSTTRIHYIEHRIADAAAVKPSILFFQKATVPPHTQHPPPYSQLSAEDYLQQ